MPPFLASDVPPFTHSFRVIHAAASQTIRGGQAANVAATDRSHYRIQLSYIPNTVQTSAQGGLGGFSTQTPASSPIQPHSLPQPVGTVRVYAMPGGEVGIIVDGSTKNTELTINVLPHPIPKGYAHSYAYGMSGETHILNIGQITVNSGEIGVIDGFQTANLSGPLVVSGTATVNRIAFNSIEPGASITVSDTLNTLDVLQGITLTGTSIQIGRDLNMLNVGQDINLYNGSQIRFAEISAQSSSRPREPALGAVSCLSTCLRPPHWWQRPRKTRSQPTSRETSTSAPAACSRLAGPSISRCTLGAPDWQRRADHQGTKD